MITEAGIKDDISERQDDRAQAYLCLADYLFTKRTDVSALCFFAVSDINEENYGLVRKEGCTVKPEIFEAFKSLAEKY